MKHTKGKWIYAGNTTVSSRDPIFYHANVICGGIRVAQAAGVGENEAKANAYLIAAAPDLLEFAQDFFTWHANHFGDFDNPTNDQLLDLANAIEPILKEIGV